jgi:hypothetical protein
MDINNIVSQLKELDSYLTELTELTEREQWAVTQIIDITKGRPFIVDGDLIRWVDGTLISVKYHGRGMFANDEVSEKYRKYRKLSERIQEVKKEINSITITIAPMFVDYFDETKEETLVIVVNDNVYTIESDVCSKNEPCVLVSEPLFID